MRRPWCRFHTVWLTTICTRLTLLARIAEGAYYEAHQQLRVVASRYVKSQNWDAAIDILSEGSLSLLKAGQGGSGGDLGCYLIDVFSKAERPVDAEHKGKLLAILRSFPPEEPTKKKFVDEMICWSSRFGEYPLGEPELHHVAGTLYAEGTFIYFPLRNTGESHRRAREC